MASRRFKKIKEAAINIISNDILEIELSHKYAQIKFADNLAAKFDSLYSALGGIKNNKLAHDVNAKLIKDLLVVDIHQQTSVEGLFAAGDIVSGLNQLRVAASQAAIAAQQSIIAAN
ncbi:TPA: FAD-dependent oxidoreductase [Legionella feeleii]